MKELTQEDIKGYILSLINAGENLEDAAETCGHNEELIDWKKTKSLVMKSFNITKEDLSNHYRKTAIAREISREQKWRVKQEKEKAKYAKEDDEILKELGLR
jgi:hypothetical protein